MISGLALTFYLLLKVPLNSRQYYRRYCSSRIVTDQDSTVTSYLLLQHSSNLRYLISLHSFFTISRLKHIKVTDLALMALIPCKSRDMRKNSCYLHYLMLHCLYIQLLEIGTNLMLHRIFRLISNNLYLSIQYQRYVISVLEPSRTLANSTLITCIYFINVLSITKLVWVHLVIMQTQKNTSTLRLKFWVLLRTKIYVLKILSNGDRA